MTVTLPQGPEGSNSVCVVVSSMHTEDVNLPESKQTFNTNANLKCKLKPRCPQTLTPGVTQVALFYFARTS
jgi:hypothetical protein